MKLVAQDEKTNFGQYVVDDRWWHCAELLCYVEAVEVELNEIGEQN